MGEDRSYDLYAADLVGGGPSEVDASTSFEPSGAAHTTVSADGGRVSWDSDGRGGVSNIHFTDQGYGKGDSGRHPFGW